MVKWQPALIGTAMLGGLFMMEAASFGEERVTVIIEKGTLVFSPQEVTIKKGEVYEKTFTDAGTFFYHCGIHDKMWGKITVEE